MVADPDVSAAARGVRLVVVGHPVVDGLEPAGIE